MYAAAGYSLLEFFISKVIGKYPLHVIRSSYEVYFEM
jgi:hypothetical protein